MIRQAKLSDRDVVVKILTTSFNENPAVNDTIIADRHRSRRLIALMEYVFDTGYARNGVFLMEDFSGAIVMYDPVAFPTKTADLFRQIKLVHRCIGWSRAVYASRKDNRMAEQRPKTPHYYLQMIGTVPEKQGTGVGSEMIRFIQELSVKNAKPVFLETSVAKNVDIYRRKGFEIHGDWKIREDYHVRFMNWKPA